VKNEKIGVVVIGRNEGSRLILCLDSILKVNVPCVYIDSQSTDSSIHEAEKRNIKNLVLDKSAPVNASRARNTGFKLLIENYSTIEYVHFIDADCELHSDWLKHAVAALDEVDNRAVVCGRLHEKDKDKNIYTRLCDIDWYVPPGDINACGGISTIKRQVFEEMQGFDESLIAGADPELYFRISQAGYDLYCLSVDMGTHDSNMQHFSQYWNRSVKTGYGYAHNKYQWGGWDRQYKSAMVWGGAIPSVILLGVLSGYFYTVLALIVYPLQIIRIFLQPFKMNLKNKDKLIYASFCVLGKFSEFRGIIRYYWVSFLKKEQSIIEYKK